MAPSYKPVGQCIYCGATKYSIDKVRLANEHIVPFCLDGAHVLPRASCLKCGEKTGKLENQFFSRDGTWRAARVHAGSRSRHNTNKTVRLYVGKGADERAIDLPAATAPLWVIQLTFNRLGLLDGEPVDAFRENNVLLHIVQLRQGPLPASPFYTPSIRVEDAMRFLAKVAHSYAVAELSLTGFSPLLKDFILGKGERVPHAYFGPGPTLADPPDEPYHIGLRVEEMRGARYVLVDICLLSAIRFSPYTVVAGILTP